LCRVDGIVKYGATARRVKTLKEIGDADFTLQQDDHINIPGSSQVCDKILKRLSV